MAKKKKKEKLSADDAIAEYNLDSALKTSKTTESTLHNLLQSVSEEPSFISSKKEDVRIEPQLSYEIKRQIADDYVLEDKPLSERGPVEGRPKIPEPLIDKKEVEPSSEKPISKVDTTIIEPSFSKKNSIYAKLGDFFLELFEGYTERYDRWENTTSSILSILRKMRKITKKNSEDLVESINNIYKNVQHNLENFKIKRDEVEKITEVDIESMSSEFKKVLGLLELQVKEYQYKRLTDEYIKQQNSL
ncbi:MAG: hypothetical protein ACFFKA_11190 [Candidatus Thorarchaeota archaeon]